MSPRGPSFGLPFTGPDAVGTELRVPTTQTCEAGSLHWIQAETDVDRPARA